MHLDSLALHYSSQETLTISQLKAREFDLNSDFKERKNYCEKHQISAITQENKIFPQRAKTFSQSPFVLYYQGNLDLLQCPSLGIVGPRMPSEYGLQVMDALFSTGDHYKFITISGFARGIDQQAHQLSLSHKIPTVAILWGGFRHYLRSRDREFLAKIVDAGGLVLSAFKLWFEPTKWSFPQRNKLIAGFSDLLFLPEAREKSGSLITAEFAYQMGKPVFSVPAPLFSPQSAGIFSKMNEKKIQLITDFDACLKNHFNLRGEEIPWAWILASKADLSEQQFQIFQMIVEQWEMTLEQLMRNGFSYQALLQELTFLELKKRIEEFQPGRYRKKLG